MIKNKFFTLIAVFLLGAVLLLTACRRSQPPTPNPETSENGAVTTENRITAQTTAPSASDDTNITSSPETLPPEDLKINVTSDTVSKEYNFEGETLINHYISYPKLETKDGIEAEKINRALFDFAEELARITGDDKTLAKDDYEMAEIDGIDFEMHEKTASFSYFIRGSLISFKFDTHTLSGGAGDLWTTYALSFDLVSGEKVLLSDVLDMSGDEAKKFAVDKFSELIRKNPENYFSDALELLPSELSLDSFYLSKEGITIFLNTYSIAPSALGTQSILIEY